MKRNSFLVYFYMLVAGFLFAGCSEWDDHYDADTSLLASQQATLWENISKADNLKQFASLLQKAGYDSVLNATQTYTVWAPVDGSFDYDQLSSYDASRLQKEFIQNHIARNNYPVSGAIDNKHIYTLNEKLMIFNGSSEYTIQGVGLSKANVASSNGVIHLLSGKIPYAQNLYESLNTNDYAIDSISNFFHTYDVKKLNELKSVPGPTLNGQVTYLDSVFDEHNELFSQFYAYINREDSNYTMIVPTNEAWTKAKAEISKYYNYLPSFEFMENTSTVSSESKKITVNIDDVEYLKDSIVNMMLLKDLFYNNNIYDNKKLNNLKTGETLQCDSLYGTTFTKLYSEDAANLFENATRIDMSNGAAWLTDSLRMRSWTSWNPELIIEAEERSVLSSTLNVYDVPQRTYVVPGTQNPEIAGKVSGNTYLEVQPVTSSTNPGIVFYLPGVRSTTYSIYIVMVPANIVSTTRESKPNLFNVTMGYATATGKNDDRGRSWLAASSFSTDTTKVDTVYLGDFTFPMAYYGTGNYYPYLRINSAVRNAQRLQYDRTMRIDCLILRPKELDNYLKEHPDYKYDTGLY
jgi:uncharacterized surface protein with fasciclin (FAS1) repeats